ncbi:hypothetical protein [Burkholderia cepacia]|uniref:hypothetical protein n=1 Tax=Burkholderia cepacia TaxID=292 RepID=UPI000A8393DD|nr:hypothetical protein [Burkholderia cepacia]
MNLKRKPVDALALKPPRKPANGDKEHPEVGETRNRARLLYPVETLAHMSAEDAATVQHLLQHGEAFGVWDTRRDWLATGAKNTTVDLRKRIVRFLPQEVRQVRDELYETLLEQSVLTLVRYLCLLRMGPSGKGRDSFRALSPSFVRDVAFNYGPPLMAIAIAKRISFLRGSHQEGNLGGARLNSDLLSDLTSEDLEPLTQNARRKVLQEWKRMEMLGHLGLWSDVPALSVRSLSKAMTGPARYNEAPPKRNAHLPLPDDYVAELGFRGLWLIYDLAPNLLQAGEQLVQVWKLTDKPHLAPDTIRDARSNAARATLENFEWKDSKGAPIEKPPFALYLPKAHGFGVRGDRGDEAGEQRWPPRNYRDFMGLAGALQAAHLTVGLLSMGPRRSEILSLKRSCVAYASDGRRYADGRTFKLVERHEGELRDWLLPEVAVTAFEQQVRLVTLCERVSSLSPQRAAQPEVETSTRHLWGRISAAYMSNANVPLSDVNPTLISYARTLGLDIAPGGQNLRSHRFRKTLARLVALALTQAPRLLMEIFGHRSIEMTLYYILADKELRAEIETVSRELRIMRATTVVEKMVEADVVDGDELGGYGGPAAASIHKAIEIQRQQTHRQGKDWEISSAAELAELLTLQGKAWEQVRPGVICTKFPGESGPCNKSKGRPEPSKCRSDCSHRLEEAFLREDINGAIHDSLVAYEQAIADDESLTASHWAAQIRAHVPRFRDLQKKWMDHPTVKALMSREDSKATA